MWVVANYVGCLSAIWPSGLKEIAAASREALRDLPHDHCARYLAHVNAEACALLGDKQGLREIWNQYRSYFDCEAKKDEWFEPRRRPLLTEIPELVGFLEQNRGAKYRWAVLRMRWRPIARYLNPRRRLIRAIPIPWWALLILAWTLIQLVRNS